MYYMLRKVDQFFCFFRRRRHYYEVMLRRLSESERISEEENSVLWEKIKKQVEKEFDDVMAGRVVVAANKEFKKCKI